MHFLCPTLMRHYRQCTIVMSSLLLTWCKDTCSWQWQKMTLRRLHLEQVSGLYEFTHMSFGLSNAGSSFCTLMEQCIGDQQFVTLLLYLDDICIFASDVGAMLDQIELVFNWLKSFNLKSKPKNATFFSLVIFLGYVLLADRISANPEK